MSEAQATVLQESPKERQFGIDLLRIVLMFLIVLRHGSFQSGAITETHVLKLNYYLGMGIDLITAVAVNCFVLISGYFLCQQSFRLSRLLNLWFRVVFFSVLVFLTALCIPSFPVSFGLGLRAFLPISGYFYWFISLYFCITVFSPYFNQVIHGLDKRGFQIFLGVLVFVFSVLPTVGWGHFAVPEGYTLTWFTVLYFTGAYMRLHWPVDLPRKEFIRFCVCIVISGLVWLSAKKLASWGWEIPHPDSAYDFISTFLASVFFFRFFASLDIQNVKLRSFITTVAPLTIGCYLFHDHVLKHKLWKSLLRMDTHCESYLWFIFLILCVSAVFVVGALIEYGRIRLANAIGLPEKSKKIERWLMSKVKKG